MINAFFSADPDRRPTFEGLENEQVEFYHQVARLATARFLVRYGPTADDLARLLASKDKLAGRLPGQGRIASEVCAAGKKDDTNQEGQRSTEAKALVQAKLPVFVKPRIQTVTLKPSYAPAGNEYTRAVTTLSCRCGTKIIKITFNNKPAYVWPLVDRVKNNPEMARLQWKIDMQHIQRDPKDMTKLLQYQGKRDSTGTPRKILQNLFIRVPDNENEKNLEFNIKWGTLLARVYNTPFVQSQIYGDNSLAYYAGDLNPHDGKGERPFLSDYLTVKHAMTVVEYAYSNLSREEILESDTVLGYFFPKNKLEFVREQCGNARASHSSQDFDEGPTFDSMV